LGENLGFNLEAVQKRTKKVEVKLAKHNEKHGDNLDKYFDDDSDSLGSSSDDSLDADLGNGEKGATGGADPSKLIDFELIKLL
jgi:hypothetical protein